MPRNIDKQIEDAWKRELRADADGNRAMAFVSRMAKGVLQKSKKEQVQGGYLLPTPDTRKPPKPKARRRTAKK